MSSNTLNALVKGVAAVAVANCVWVLIRVDPNTWEFAASAVAALVGLEVPAEFRRRRAARRQSAQN
ncbi:hypothetical protein ACFC36_16145 [Streptomyces rubiginosohelvolus]|uniref:hypothetical protein n=1 Tax=Streptomyces rubiginosohelvolus TaxID=67362 RepID=UPI0035DCA9F3